MKYLLTFACYFSYKSLLFLTMCVIIYYPCSWNLYIYDVLIQNNNLYQKLNIFSKLFFMFLSCLCNLDLEAKRFACTLKTLARKMVFAYMEMMLRLLTNNESFVPKFENKRNILLLICSSRFTKI